MTKYTKLTASNREARGNGDECSVHQEPSHKRDDSTPDVILAKQDEKMNYYAIGHFCSPIYILYYKLHSTFVRNN